MSWLFYRLGGLGPCCPIHDEHLSIFWCTANARAPEGSPDPHAQAVPSRGRPGKILASATSGPPRWDTTFRTEKALVVGKNDCGAPETRGYVRSLKCTHGCVCFSRQLAPNTQCPRWGAGVLGRLTHQAFLHVLIGELLSAGCISKSPAELCGRAQVAVYFGV